ncbi:putative isomerase YbhE [Marasmius fiardii PR-910]|nr:putative isomerase YbhE [Marasmius fiardii PR-910]
MSASTIYQILAPSYTDSLHTLSFSPTDSKITASNSTKVGHHPSWATSHPTDPTLVFTCLEQSEGIVLAVKYDKGGNGQGQVVAEAASGGKDPCHLLVKDSELLIANYTSGSFSVLPITPDAQPPYILSKTPTTTIQLTGTGPNKERQESPHAHGVFWIDETNELLIPNLGGDVVHRLRRTDDGKWSIVGEIRYPAGGGPRHLAVHGGILYTLLELSSQIIKHQLFGSPKEPLEAPRHLATVSTLSHPLPSPNPMLAAEILIPKLNATYPTPYVYVSNRNDPSRDGDTIGIFEASMSDSLDLVGEIRTGLNHVRGMAFGGPEDRWLIAGGGVKGGVKVYERVDGGRGLKLIAGDHTVEAPTGFIWM